YIQASPNVGTQALLLAYSTTVGDRAEVEGDANGDGVVNFGDLNAVLSTFGGVGAAQAGDVNADGRVDFADLNEVLSHFGA
ncbi:MAG: dockerin type I domain-containing protein, partial [Phycisphaerales bacterium]